MQVLVSTRDREQEKHWVRLLEGDGYSVVAMPSGREALRAMQSESGPRIAIFAEASEGLKAGEICRRLRAMSNARYVYCIVMVAENSREKQDALLDAGADDVIGTLFDWEELTGRLRNAKRVLNLQEQLIAAREALRFESTHDATTAVLNRSGIGEHLRREFERASRFNKSLGLIMVDLDHFRIINESFGYAAGDGVLRELATRIKTSTRAYDIVGRYGADEFVILAPETTAVALAAQAERVLSAISTVPVSFEGQEILLTASIGVALSEDRTATELLQSAEDAVKRAKLTGRNSVEFARNSSFDPALMPLMLDPRYRVH